MKINHRRQRDKPRRDGDRYAGSPIGEVARYSPLADVVIGAGWGDNASGGRARDAGQKKAAKKYTNSRVRFQENAATRKLAEADGESAADEAADEGRITRA